MTPTANSAKAVFVAALDYTDRSQRAAYLETACAGAPQLRKRVEALLRAHDEPHALLDQPAANHLASAGNSLDFLEPSSRSDSFGRLGHYEVLEVIGRGGMGIVLKAFDEKLHRVVALKVLAPILSLSEIARHRFVREARAAAAVSHEHITAIHAVEDSGPNPYLVMQCVQGCTLQDKLDRVGRLSTKEALRIGMEIASGLAAAHRKGLIHRDVKPANILLENGAERVKITDFGLAHAVDTDGLMHSLVIAGTPAFMSPEQAEGLAIDCRSDLFSLGSVLYTLCAGGPPFAGDTSVAVMKRICGEVHQPLREVNPTTPAWLEAIIAKLLAKRPEERYSSAAEVVEVLGSCLAKLQASATSACEPSTQEWKPASSVRRVLISTGVVVLCLGLGWAIHAAVQTRESPLNNPPTPDPPSASNPTQPLVLSPIRTLQRHTGPVRVAAFSPNGKVLATAGEDRIVLLWDTGTWQAREVATTHTGAIIWLAFSPNGERIATVTSDKEDCHVRLWAVATGKPAGTLGGASAGVWGVCWSPDGARIAAAGWDKTLRVWNAASGDEVFAVESVAERFVRGLAYSPKGDQIVTGSSGSATRLWDANTGHAIPSKLPPNLCPTFLPTGDGVIGWQYEKGEVVICDVPSGRIRSCWQAYTNTIDGLALSPDGRFVATLGRDVARLFALDDQREVATLVGHHGTIYGAAFAPDATILATVGFHDSTVRIWELPPVCRSRK